MKIISILLALFCIGAIQAQEISFTASIDRTTIAAGERLRLTISLTNSRQQFTAPDLGGLVVVQGPFESSSLSEINGRVSSTISRTYILTATRPGRYTIGSSKVRVGNGVIETDPIVIEVGQAATRPKDPAIAQGQQSDPNLFVTINLSKNKAYVGEQVVASYTLYSRYNNLEISRSDLPALNGFWAEDIDLADRGWEDALETFNGLQYRVAVLHKQVLFPQRSGKLRIEPMELTCVVNRSFFSRGSTISISSNAVEFTAQDLPPNAPPNFNGSVGDLQMSLEADRTSVTADEAIELNVRFSGRANLKLLDRPALDLPSDFEVYDPKVNDRIAITTNGMSGHREFQFLVIPRHEGSYELDPITFSYFDPRSGSYKTLKSDPITIEVSPGTQGPATRVGRSGGHDVTVLDKDIRYIRTGELDLRAHGDDLFGSPIWTIGMAAPALAFLIFLGWYRQKEAAEADQAGTRRRKADKLARRRLSEAAKALDKDQREGFYAALSKALNGYLADKFGMGLADLNTSTVREQLAGHPNGQALANEYVELIRICEMARFAPIEERPRKESYEQAVRLIGNIERQQ